MKKNIVICADDFAQNEAISDAIIYLSENKRISATSCMTNIENWRIHSKKLKKVQSIDKGLHLNLTHGLPLNKDLQKCIGKSPLTLIELLKKINLKQFTQQMIEQEIIQQLECFEKHAEQIPDFIDGHQHIHHFPLIRYALIKVYNEKYGSLPLSQKPYIRVASAPPSLMQSFLFKKKIIQWLGAKKLKTMLQTFNIPHNTAYFYGIYPFNKHYYYPNVLRPILKSIEHGSLLMCHPGLSPNENSDPIAYHRFKEYSFLMSDEFSTACLDNQLHISRFER